MTFPISFLQAAHFTKGPRSKIDLIVIHTAEVAPSPGAATNLMRACSVTPDLKSWHYAIDSSVITQSVRDVDIAWHAPGANNNGLGIELATRATTR